MKDGTYNLLNTFNLTVDGDELRWCAIDEFDEFENIGQYLDEFGEEYPLNYAEGYAFVYDDIIQVFHADILKPAEITFIEFQQHLATLPKWDATKYLTDHSILRPTRDYHIKTEEQVWDIGLTVKIIGKVADGLEENLKSLLRNRHPRLAAPVNSTHPASLSGSLRLCDG